MPPVCHRTPPQPVFRCRSFHRFLPLAFHPRILHFHTCGAEPPGEISWNLFDPTIDVDGVRLWEHGRFHLERLEEGRRILASYPDVAKVFAEPDRNIGLAEDA